MNIDQKRRLIPHLPEIMDILEDAGLLSEADAGFASLADICNAISNMCKEIQDKTKRSIKE